MKQNQKLMSAALEDRQAKPEVAKNPSMTQGLQYLKARLLLGQIFSVPKSLFDVIRPGPDSTPITDPKPITDDGFIKAASITNTEYSGDIHSLTFFEIVDAFPERNVQIRRLHAVKQLNLVEVRELNVTAYSLSVLHSLS